MRTIGAAEFKAHCLQILDELGPEGVVITKRGRPVAKLVPPPRSNMALLGKYKDKIEIRGDLFSTGIRWDAES